MPPLAFDTRPADLPKGEVKPLTPQERRLFDSMLLHEDRDIFILNKPSGFALGNAVGDGNAFANWLM